MLQKFIRGFCLLLVLMLYQYYININTHWIVTKALLKIFIHLRICRFLSWTFKINKNCASFCGHPALKIHIRQLYVAQVLQLMPS